MRSIILIGPFGVGKSTIGCLLAKELELSSYSLDDYSWKYYSEKGLTRETAKSFGGFNSPLWQPYHAHAVKRFLQDYQNKVCVMDFGAWDVLYEENYIDEMRLVFAPYNVILLLPSPNIDISLQDLNKRNAAHDRKQEHPHTQWNTDLLAHPSSCQLAKYTIYTIGQTPAETCKAILELNLE